MPCRTAIVLLNWNQEDLTLACLRALRALNGVDFCVILVDNGSRPGSLDTIEVEFPEVTWIKHDRNLGFTGGNNAGIRHALAAGADYIMLLNNDTEVAPDMLRLLVDFAEADPSIGVVGPLIYYYDDPKRIWSAGGAVNSFTAASAGLAEGEVDEGKRTPCQVDYISGCALLIRRAVVEQIGLLDERFFIYYEETDWCARAREAGYQVWLVPQARVWHKISLQTRAVSPRYLYLMTRNRLLYLRKRGASWMRVLWVILASNVHTLLSWSWRPRHRDKRALRIYLARGVVDFLRGRFGEPDFA